MIVPNKFPNQTRTLNLHVNLGHNHHRGRMTTLQRLRSRILLTKLFLKTNLVIPEAENTTYALILTLITQNYADIEVRIILIQLLLCASLIHFIHFFLFFTHTLFKLFFLFSFGAYTYHQYHQLKLTETQHPHLSKQFTSTSITTRASIRRTKFPNTGFCSNRL